MAHEFDHLELDGKRIHTALRYGITQALLDAIAKSKHTQMANIIAEEYHTEVSHELIPIFSQSGNNRYDNVDKMILKASAVLPHGLINHVESKLGYQGEKLLDYVKWLRQRIDEHKNTEDYSPVFHIDVYGTLGIIFKEDYDSMVDYLETLRVASGPYHLRIEGPVDFDNREKTMLGLKIITEKLDQRKIDVEIVADEWCNTLEDIKEFADIKAGHMVQIKTPDLGGIQNTVEAVLYCKEKGIGAYQGGTCNETDISAKTCVHLAMATQPCQILAKPGMGVDEGFMIVYNEMQRIIALDTARKANV
jgi:methylaspartate ammonia-lyase